MISLGRLLVVLSAAPLAASAAPEWVGSRACQPCHPAIYSSYQRTPMAQSSGTTGASAFPESFKNSAFEHAPSGYSYSVRRPLQGKGYVLEWMHRGERSRFQRSLPFYVGSGAIARSYLWEQDGFLYQSPVAYYAGNSKWDMAPGYSRYNQPFLTRPILPACLECHASAVQHREPTQNGYASPPFREGGISCERCHGPGAEHVSAMKSGRPSTRSTIVNPSKLSADRRDSVCAQCHLTGEVRVNRARMDVQPFVAGDLLQNHVAVFVRAQSDGGMRVTSHGENLAQSACKQASGDRLWCGTCHDPHTVPEVATRAAWYRSKCLTCHKTQSCTEQRTARQARKDDCAACHMPRNPVSDAQHVVYTNHAIPRRVSPSRSEAPATELASFGKTKASDRDLGVAYAILAQRDANDSYRKRAFELLGSAVRTGPKDAEALLYLADLHNRRSEREQAVHLYEEAIALDSSQLTASVSLGAIRMEQGNYPEAIRLWKDALAKNPALLLVRTNLASALLKVGERAQAEAVVRRATDFNPGYVAPRWLADQFAAAP